MTARRLIWFGLLLAVALVPFRYAPYMSGDAVIHLVYGENAAAGHLLSFNPGEGSSGETSPGYMLLIMPMYWAVGASLVPLTVKVLCFTAWYLSLLLTFAIARRLFGKVEVAAAVACLVGLMPGSVQNAVCGMENVLFSALVLGWFLTALRWRWFDGGCGTGKELLLGSILGIGVWLRPEALPLAFIVAFARLAIRAAALGAPLRMEARAALYAVLPVALLLAAEVVWHWVIAGTVPYGAAAARATLSATSGIDLGLVTIHVRFLTRLVYYAPLTVLFLAGLFFLGAGLRKRVAELLPLQVSATIFLGFVVLYSTVFSDVHVARYTLFLWPFFAFVAAFGVLEGWRRLAAFRDGRFLPLGKASLTLCALAAAVVFAAEVYMREQQSLGEPISEVARAPAQRADYTDKLLARSGFARGQHIDLGMAEVHMRYYYDDRVSVRSLDGIVDNGCLMHFVHQGNFDHIGYLRARQIDLLAGNVNFNRDPSRWSLAELRKLKLGESLEREGLRFTRVPDNLMRVEDLRAPGNDPVIEGCRSGPSA
jgi:hypothetical protein